MDKISLSKPINKTAAMVTSKGYEYKPCKKIETQDTHLPIPIRMPSQEILSLPTFKSLTGYKFGRFTVLGIAEEIGRGWVVRCQCGTYTTRRSKAILNPNNRQDRCEQCRHLAFLKREDKWRRTGVDQDINDF
jgi:hypothetical protein